MIEVWTDQRNFWSMRAEIERRLQEGWSLVTLVPLIYPQDPWTLHLVAVMTRAPRRSWWPWR